MSSLQVGMRRNAYVEPRWICVDKWTMRYSDIHIAYCLWPMTYCLLPVAYCLLPIAYCLLPIACLDVLLRMDALGNATG